MRIVKNSLSKLSNYPRLRILLIIAGIVIIFIVIMNLLISPSPKNNAAPPSQVQAVTNSNTQNQKTVPQNEANNYQALATVAAKNTVQQAAQTGNSNFQNAFGDSNNPNPTSTSASSNNPQLASDVATLQKQLNQDSQSQSGQSSAASQSESATDAAAAAQKQEAMNSEFQSIQTSMRSGLQNVTNSWQLPTLSSVQGTAQDASSASTTAEAPVAIKAGTILFGVIDTALDSDQPGTPVLATIVTGPYKGAKLLGGFVAENDALVIQFNIMTIPSQPSSIPISAYAIDENTANNALASNVDNHYMLRYGMLFASAFLQGFGTAYQNTYYCPPGTQSCNIYSNNGPNLPPDNSTTTKTAAYQGLGQVGTTLSQVAAQQFNTPPTITVNQGTAIGVLFNADLQIPT